MRHTVWSRPRPKTRTDGLIGIVLLVVLVLAAAAFGIWLFACPCERTPGAYLLGPEVTEPVRDWSFVNDRDAVPLCQIQVNAGLLPHSINLNCMATEGALYLSCSSCKGKRWSSAVLAHPEARLRAAWRVYPVTVSRVEAPDELDRAWVARAAKLGRTSDAPRQPGWWSFRVESR
jgi:hypothetical protein